MADNESTQPTLEELTREYYSVRRAEFEVDQIELDAITDQVRVRSQKLVAAAIETMAFLLEHAESDAVRWQVAKYLMDNHVFDKETPEDELGKIISALQAKAKV